MIRPSISRRVPSVRQSRDQEGQQGGRAGQLGGLRQTCSSVGAACEASIGASSRLQQRARVEDEGDASVAEDRPPETPPRAL